jgi:hypothetical protein
MGMKVCKTCNEEKPLEQFGIVQKKYYNSYCKSCYKKKYPPYEWQKANKDKQAAYAKKSKKKYIEDKFYVYLIPKANYVGQTNQPKIRKWHHTKDKDTSGFKILHTYNTREKALAKEKEYHNMGYNG